MFGFEYFDLAASRWEFMSCESEFSKPRQQTTCGNGKQYRCFKKRLIQQNKYNVQPYADWGKKIYMIQNEVDFSELYATKQGYLTNSVILDDFSLLQR